MEIVNVKYDIQKIINLSDNAWKIYTLINIRGGQASVDYISEKLGKSNAVVYRGLKEIREMENVREY